MHNKDNNNEAPSTAKDKGQEQRNSAGNIEPDMTNQNGQLILQALQNLDEPATVTKIVTHIADTAGVHPNDVKESVQETLNGGVRYGYIQRSNRKYYAVPVDLEQLAGDEEGTVVDPDQEDANNAGELEDRGSRRKRRRGGKRSRSRRGSRRRRRSRR